MASGDIAPRRSLRSSAVVIFVLGLIPLVNLYAFGLWWSRLDFQRRFAVAPLWLFVYATSNTLVARMIDGTVVTETNASGGVEVSVYQLETGFFYWYMIAAIGITFWLALIGGIRWLILQMRGTGSPRVGPMTGMSPA
jgi:hypothetical protein